MQVVVHIIYNLRENLISKMLVESAILSLIVKGKVDGRYSHSVTSSVGGLHKEVMQFGLRSKARVLTRPIVPISGI